MAGWLLRIANPSPGPQILRPTHSGPRQRYLDFFWATEREKEADAALSLRPYKPSPYSQQSQQQPQQPQQAQQQPLFSSPQPPAQQAAPQYQPQYQPAYAPQGYYRQP